MDVCGGEVLAEGFDARGRRLGEGRKEMGYRSVGRRAYMRTVTSFFQLDLSSQALKNLKESGVGRADGFCGSSSTTGRRPGSLPSARARRSRREKSASWLPSYEHA